MSDFGIRSVLEWAGALPPSQPTPEERCKGKFDKNTQPKESHLCVVDENIKLHEAFRDKSMREAILKTAAVIDLVGDDTTSAKVAVGKHVNFESRNWTRLELADKCFYLYNLTGDISHLDRAAKMLTAGLAEKELTSGFDLDRFSRAGLEAEPITPVIGYFELKLSLLQILNILDPAQALIDGPKLETELANPRLVMAQRSNPESDQGYVNRLRFLKASGALYQNSPDLDKAIAGAKESAQWAGDQLNRSFLYLTFYGLSQKNLIHDQLLSQVTVGELLVRKELGKPQADRKFDEAVQIFQAVLRAPVATQKFGGFLDIGLRAFTNLLYISMQQSETRQQAAEIFADYVNWPTINNLKDFKETLGLLSRKESLVCEMEKHAIDTCHTWREGVSDWFLSWGKPGWALTDNNPIVSEIDLNNPAFSDPKTKLGITLRALQSSEIDKKMLGAIMAWWLAAS